MKNIKTFRQIQKDLMTGEDEAYYKSINEKMQQISSSLAQRYYELVDFAFRAFIELYEEDNFIINESSIAAHAYKVPVHGVCGNHADIWYWRDIPILVTNGPESHYRDEFSRSVTFKIGVQWLFTIERTQIGYVGGLE